MWDNNRCKGTQLIINKVWIVKKKVTNGQKTALFYQIAGFGGGNDCIFTLT